MSRQISSLSKISAVTIILLFPVFFFYHTALAYALIPQFLAGFFGPMAVICGVPLLSMQAVYFIMGKSKINKLDIAFIIIAAFFLVWASINFIFGVGVQRDVSFYIDSISSVYFWMVLYFAFRNIPIDSVLFRATLFACLTVMLVIALANMSSGMFYAAKAASDDVVVATYQGFARSALVTGLVAICVTRGKWVVVAFCSTIVLLFLLGARSEFVGFIVASAFITCFREGVSRTLAIWVPLAVATLAYVILGTDILSSGSRILQIFSIEQSSSYEARMEMQEMALRSIRDNPIFGDYGSQLIYGGIRSYAHNALSAWVDYGLIGFLLFIFLLIYTAFFLFRLSRPNEQGKNSLFLFALGLTVYSFLMALAAKSVYDPMFAAAWGTTAGALAIRYGHRYSR
jgi:hypothetical protein